MELLLTRDSPQPSCTPGRINVDGVFCCFSLEPSEGDFGLDDAIPPGAYPVHIRWSNKFKRMSPFVDHVPGRSAIEVHDGNVATDSEGCILVGLERNGDGTELYQSDLARQALQAKIAKAQASNESVILTVVESPRPA